MRCRRTYVLKNKTSFEFKFSLGLIASIKNIRQNIRENIVVLVLQKQHYKILRLINKTPPSRLLIWRQNLDADSVKPIIAVRLLEGSKVT